MVHEKKRWKSTALVDILCIWHIYKRSLLSMLRIVAVPEISVCKTLSEGFYLIPTIWQVLYGASLSIPNSAYAVLGRIPLYNLTSPVYLIGTLCKLSLQSIQHPLHSDIICGAECRICVWRVHLIFSVSIWDNVALLMYLVNSTVQYPRPSIYLVSCNLQHFCPLHSFLCPLPHSPLSEIKL